ncbi:MAG: D-glycero-beta-D-manno-heptose-7-phosphate kinase [Planctomycetota bacterium]
MEESRRLADALASLGPERILVVGDLILDRYVEGRAGRVSPEAPVLVFEFESERYRLGGACNVAANLRGLGAATSVLGVIGNDTSGRRLSSLMAHEGIDTDSVVEDSTRPTTCKTRYVSKTAQVLRVDEESRRPASGAAEQALLAVLGRRPFPWRSILLSDYGKGVLTPAVIAAAVAAARSSGGVVVVDPKGRDYSIYRGVDLLTPNREEAEAATGVSIRGVEDLHRAAERLRDITGITAVTITLGKDGVFVEEVGSAPQIIPTRARQVFDVTGAGDTVVAALTYCRSAGLSLFDSLAIANCAAGITVGRFGTWAPSRQEVLAMLGEHAWTRNGKILTVEEAVSVATRLRTEGRRLVFTNGCFDILHPGHTEYLARARAYGDALMVAVNDDDSVRRQQKAQGRPVNRLADRMSVLAALQSVDYVVPFSEDTPLEIVEKITPHVLAKGEDWRERGVVGREWVEAHGGQVVLVPLREGCSTTAIIEKILRECESRGA